MSIYEQYRGKKVLVTGHTGFKGAWLVAILNQLGAEIMGYALAPETENCLYHTINGDELCHSVIHDIRDKEQLQRSISEFQPDFVFHMAAQALVIKSYALPTETFDVNVVGTANLLEAISKVDNKCTVVVITTDKVYHNKEIDVAYTEKDTLGGYDPYSASKACTELVVDSFRNSFFNLTNFSQHQKAISSVRAGNVIGGGDFSENRIIPDIIRALSNNKPIEIRSPKSIRPWQHVLEPLFAYLKLGLLLDADPKKYSVALNIGPNTADTLTVEELVQKAIATMGKGEYSIVDQNTPHEAGILKLDISLASKLLDWEPIYNSSQAIEKTISWYLNEDQAQATLNQINDYLNEIS